MTFKGKPVRVIIIGDAKTTYESLESEKEKGSISSDNQTLLKAIDQKITVLKENPEYGTHIPKDRIPKEYILLYNINNLWKIDLPKGWRMIYSIKGSEVDIIALTLDIIDHPTYDKKFGYRKR